MGLFGGGNSKSSTTNNVDNSVTDQSKNINNAGASIGNTDNSTYISNVTDGGAFDVVGQAIGANQSIIDSGFEFAGGAVDGAYNLSERAIGEATDLSKAISLANMDFSQSTMDSAIDSIQKSSDSAITAALTATASESESTMNNMVKITGILAVVLVACFLVMGRKK